MELIQLVATGNLRFLGGTSKIHSRRVFVSMEEADGYRDEFKRSCCQSDTTTSQMWELEPDSIIIKPVILELQEETRPSNESTSIIACYPNGQCPDCNSSIPQNVTEGEACTNCEHVFCLERPSDDKEGRPMTATKPTFRPRPHTAWYEDGVEDGEQCWRLDIAPDIQIQLFAQCDLGPCDEPDRNTEYHSPQFFLEVDRRAPDDCDKRTHYAFLPREAISCSLAFVWLQMSPQQVMLNLAKHINQLLKLPSIERTER